MSVLAGLTAAAQVIQGVGQMNQGLYNQEVAQQQAQATRQAYQYNRGIRADQFNQQQGANLARTLASGVEISGSPLQQRIANRYRFLQDESVMEFNSEVQAQQSEAQGRLARFKGLAGMGTSLLQGGLTIGEETLGGG